MNLRAVIIGVENTAGNTTQLPGARLDAQKMASFLQSNGGGAWTASEVRHRVDPTKDQVLRDVEWAARADYSLVLFSGHGCVRMQHFPGVGQVPVTYMDASDGSEVSQHDLTPAAERVLLVFDCCRGVVEPISKAIKLAMEETAKALRVRLTAAESRRRFEAAVQQSEKGTIVVHGCDLHESAADRVSFSRTLVGISSEWSADNSGVLTVSTAFNQAKQAFALHNKTQNPQIDAGRRRTAFPFAIGSWE